MRTSKSLLARMPVPVKLAVPLAAAGARPAELGERIGHWDGDHDPLRYDGVVPD
ncbi:MAG TPA: hypothetical protein VE733_16740 [Streptosporangiaceae bacterium]|jgi:hypothetical protein|nr:hypothetical protein [Streptosporangiaceae bacterium]